MAWQGIREAAETCLPPDGNSHVEPRQMAMQQCDDTSRWQTAAGGEAVDGPLPGAAAESCNVAAGGQGSQACSQRTSAGAEHLTEDEELHSLEEQLAQCEPDSSAETADGADFCIVCGNEELGDVEELEGVSVFGLTFLLLVFALLTIVYMFRKVRPIVLPCQSTHLMEIAYFRADGIRNSQ
jgi:hypothetical protein